MILNDAIDTAATENLHRFLRDSRGGVPGGAPGGAWPAMFDAGNARVAHDQMFPPLLADRIAELLFSIPPSARYYAKQQFFQRLRRLPLEPGQGLSIDDLARVWTELAPSLGLRPLA